MVFQLQPFKHLETGNFSPNCSGFMTDKKAQGQDLQKVEGHPEAAKHHPLVDPSPLAQRTTIVDK